MRRRCSGAVSRAGWLTVVLLTALLFGQLGVGPTLLTIWTGEAADRCGACPCKALDQLDAATAAADPDHDHDDDGDRCPDDETPSDECPPGCDDCACCPAKLLAVVPNLGPGPRSALAGWLWARPPPVGPPSHELARIFRPPERHLV
ncbi:MAG: hypothetical protein JRI23_15890 [Deltaproteobacteria bacterium]|nr:hypothetical protein [Deltaproteobacteria bacterium]MBW2533246.1 hypothetical protein [Deltaproteobacteria bacterium]